MMLGDDKRISPRHMGVFERGTDLRWASRDRLGRVGDRGRLRTRFWVVGVEDQASRCGVRLAAAAYQACEADHDEHEENAAEDQAPVLAEDATPRLVQLHARLSTRAVSGDRPRDRGHMGPPGRTRLLGRLRTPPLIRFQRLALPLVVSKE